MHPEMINRAEIPRANLARDSDENNRLQAVVSELEAFSYSVSHDLRAPLRAVAGFTRTVLERHAAGLDDEGRRLLLLVKGQAESMQELIDDLLAFSQASRQPLRADFVNMEDLAQGTFDDLVAPKAGSVPTFILKPLPPACGDRSLLRQVFVNLIANAIKFSSHESEPAIEVGGERVGDECRYYVRDNGVGFDPRYTSRLFAVFQRLHLPEEFEGTGVGLALVQRIVLRHGGTVSALGRLGAGATFYFNLPQESRT
jgi:light-regulated signal transduction histidine kinase (bacteriophytochrome)